MLPDPPPREAGKLDWTGLVMMATGLPLLTYAFTEFGSLGHIDLIHVALPFVLSIVLLGSFARHALRIPAPLLDLRLMKNPRFAAASASNFFLAACLFGAMILLPLYLQNIRHESVIGIGFGFVPAMSVAFASLKRHELGHATPQLNVLQRTGGSIGTALLAVVLQHELIGRHTLNSQAGAYGIAFWASAVLAAVSVIPCLALLRTERRARAEASAASDDPAALVAEAQDATPEAAIA
jgi:MFS family permease